MSEWEDPVGLPRFVAWIRYGIAVFFWLEQEALIRWNPVFWENYCPAGPLMHRSTSPDGSELRTSLLAFSCHREPLDALLSITSGLSLTEVWNECSDFE